MSGHPAIAYLAAMRILEEGPQQHDPRRPRKKTAPRRRTLRLGRYRLTLTKEASGVPGTV